MCIHYINAHTCGHYAYNFDHTANSHCTEVQRQLSIYRDQPNANPDNQRNYANLNPGLNEWPILPPQVCPISWPANIQTAPTVSWADSFTDPDIQGWLPFTDGHMNNFIRGFGNPSQNGRGRRYAQLSEHPTLGDYAANVRLIKVPWGCGFDIGRCSVGLAGHRCPEKEIVRERNLVDRLWIDGYSTTEIELALLEEARIRHLEDVRALELGFDPATPIFYDPTRAMRTIQWWWLVNMANGYVVNRQSCSQLWGGASVVGILDPSPPSSSTRKQKSSKGRKKGKGKQREDPAPLSATTNPCQEEGHRGPNPFLGTLHDTDDETLEAHGRALPLHTDTDAHRIIDGSLEYVEAMEQRTRPGHAATRSISCPTIVTQSGRLILEGSPDDVETVEDGVIEDMVDREQEGSIIDGVDEAVRRDQGHGIRAPVNGLVHGFIFLRGHGTEDQPYPETVIGYYERPRNASRSGSAKGEDHYEDSSTELWSSELQDGGEGSSTRSRDNGEGPSSS